MMRHASAPKLFAVSLVTLLIVFFNLQIFTPVLGTTQPAPQTGGSTAVAKEMVNTGTKVRLATSTQSTTYYPFNLNRLNGAIAAPVDRVAVPVATAAPAVAQAIPVADPNIALYSRPAINQELQHLIDQVQNGDGKTVRGIYVDHLFALPVVQQPLEEPAFVSTDTDTLTQFHSAQNNGVTGILAHNFLSGILFYEMKLGQRVVVVYGDGSLRAYQISEIHQYQKLNQDSLTSDLIDLNTGERVTTNQVFYQYYSGSHHLTFQTCLERNGLSSWGLTFVVAQPLAQ